MSESPNQKQAKVLRDAAGYLARIRGDEMEPERQAGYDEAVDELRDLADRLERITPVVEQ